ncbi:hypothetical protein TIFTF001_027469 [Ficus carica]|uniref:Ubiquitin-like protease family profile domain-containing protein n=1 Tax=Ficus carica TaxID=3494 RepID=A0AA88DN91_FICCA|nr:hypothetical protein TIFTF001_027469 [Ficus carica]
MNGLKRVEGFSEYVGVDGSGKKFCAKGEMSSGLKSNQKGEAVRGVKVTTASMTRVDISSDMKKSSNMFDKPMVFDKSGSWPKLTVLDEVLKGEIASMKPSGWAFSKFFVKTPQTVSQQPNLYDCGVFAINIMESRDMSELTPRKFCSEDERVRLVLKMVMSNFNKNQKTLFASAMRHHEMIIDDCIGYGA